MYRLLLAAAVAFTITGCGTMANLQGKEYVFLSADGVRKPRIFGGVMVWTDAMKELEFDDDRDESFSLGQSLSLLPLGLLHCGFVAVDISASAVADTLTIPVVIVLRQHWEKIRANRGEYPVPNDPGNAIPESGSIR